MLCDKHSKRCKWIFRDLPDVAKEAIIEVLKKELPYCQVSCEEEIVWVERNEGDIEPDDEGLPALVDSSDEGEGDDKGLAPLVDSSDDEDDGDESDTMQCKITDETGTRNTWASARKRCPCHGLRICAPRFASPR